MKKTLLLLALLGGIPAQAALEQHFAKGYSVDNFRTEAYNNPIVGSMCWAANASNVLAWWQDQLVAQGYTLPQGVPQGMKLYPEYQAAFYNSGGNTDAAIEWWLDGFYSDTSKMKDPEGHPGGYYAGMLVQEEGSYNENSLIAQFFPGTFMDLDKFTAEIVKRLDSGCGCVARIQAGWNVTIWGVELDTETNRLTKIYYSDPHDQGTSYAGSLSIVDVPAGDGYTDTYQISGYSGSKGTMQFVTAINSNLDSFLTEEAYTDRGNGAFAPFGNVELDNGTSYTISKAVKAAGEDSALAGKANGDLTIKNGTAILADGASIQGKVIFSAGSAEGSRTLSVQRDGLTLSSVKVDSDTNNTLEVTDGNDVTISSMIGEGTLVKTGVGTLVNGGTLGNIELQGGTLKGSGSFASLTMNGGTLIVGNSPGRQTYTEALTVNMGDIVFSVGGWKTAADSEQFGWDSGTYSNIMLGEGGALTLGEGANVKFAVGGEALATLLSGKGGFSMDIATGIGNTGYFSSDLLRQLALQTKFYIATEEGAAINNSNELSAGADLTTRIYNLAYNLKDGGVLSVSGSFEQQVIPEPATGSLGLLALAGLCIRRRRK